MTQTSNDAKRQAIQAQKKQKEAQQNEILAGVVDKESKTYTFNKTVTVNGTKKTGTFTAKYMGVTGRLRLGSIRAKLLDGAPSQSLDVLTDDLAYMIAYLTVALIETPSWWSYDALEDIEDLQSMYQEVFNFMQSFRAENGQDSNAGHSSATSSQETLED